MTTPIKTTEQLEIERLEAEIERLKAQLENVQCNAGAYYLVLECESCEEEIYFGLCLTTLEHRGYPAISYDIASQTKFHCNNCGADNYTGDFDVFVEGGPEPGASDEDDEE